MLGKAEVISALEQMPNQERLEINDERRAEPFIIKSRSMWIKAGLHPPADDPQDPC
ncbi:MAG: hypothetical protein HC921_05520 [Synechococcaceae cyanobacterium SM2_3_1]|nr:hypothetical protein [Synechococcaceae cyanobacterium SM2_3_1]